MIHSPKFSPFCLGLGRDIPGKRPSAVFAIVNFDQCAGFFSPSLFQIHSECSQITGVGLFRSADYG
jgi:hypothetical protein